MEQHPLPPAIRPTSPPSLHPPHQRPRSTMAATRTRLAIPASLEGIMLLASRRTCPTMSLIDLDSRAELPAPMAAAPIPGYLPRLSSAQHQV